MNAAFSLQLTVWIWLLFGLIALVGFVALAFGAVMFRRLQYTPDWWLILTLLAAAYAGTSLFSIAATAAGWPLFALHFYRFGSAVIVIFGIFLSIRIARVATADPAGTTPLPPVRSAVRWSVAVLTAVIGAMTWLAFHIPSLPLGPVSITIATTNLPALDGNWVWASIWFGTFVLLGGGATIFFVLFARRVQRGGVTKLESHWEGIGGGLGGWRMSSALSHLLLGTALALLFTVLLLRFDRRIQDRELAARPNSSPAVTPAPTMPPR